MKNSIESDQLNLLFLSQIHFYSLNFLLSNLFGIKNDDVSSFEGIASERIKMPILFLKKSFENKNELNWILIFDRLESNWRMKKIYIDTKSQ